MSYLLRKLGAEDDLVFRVLLPLRDHKLIRNPEKGRIFLNGVEYRRVMSQVVFWL